MEARDQLHLLAERIPFSAVILPAPSRSEEAISDLVADTTRLVDEIELPREFPPKESLDQIR